MLFARTFLLISNIVNSYACSCVSLWTTKDMTKDDSNSSAHLFLAVILWLVGVPVSVPVSVYHGVYVFLAASHDRLVYMYFTPHYVLCHVLCTNIRNTNTSMQRIHERERDRMSVNEHRFIPFRTKVRTKQAGNRPLRNLHIIVKSSNSVHIFFWSFGGSFLKNELCYLSGKAFPAE